MSKDNFSIYIEEKMLQFSTLRVIFASKLNLVGTLKRQSKIFYFQNNQDFFFKY